MVSLHIISIGCPTIWSGKINNNGEIEYTVVQGTYEPIVTVEEFETAQKIFKNHQRELLEFRVGQRRYYGNR